MLLLLAQVTSGRFQDGMGSLKDKKGFADTFQPGRRLFKKKKILKGHPGAYESPLQWITATVNKVI